jgi:hypothetical protein
LPTQAAITGSLASEYKPLTIYSLFHEAIKGRHNSLEKLDGGKSKASLESIAPTACPTRHSDTMEPLKK